MEVGSSMIPPVSEYSPEVEEEGLVTVGWMEGRSRDPFDKDFLPLHSQGWEESCSRLSLLRGSVSRQAYED